MLELSLPTTNGPKDIKRIGSVQGAAKGLISSLQQSNIDLTLLITHNNDEAERLKTELEFFLSDEQTLLHFPDWEILPYDVFSPHQDIISQRLACLSQLANSKKAVLIISINTLMHQLAPKEFIHQQSFLINQRQELDSIKLSQQLSEAGYQAVDSVYHHGEFALRGSIIDLYPMGSEQAYRIELFDTEVESIRTFDPENQRSIEQVKNIHLLPAKEFPFNAQALEFFKQNWRTKFAAEASNCHIYKDISSGICPAGIEYYSPLFFSSSASLFDYLPKQTCIISSTGLEQAARNFLTEVEQRYQQRCSDILRPILEPKTLFLSIEQLFSQLNNHSQIILNPEAEPKKDGRYNIPNQELPDLSVDNKAQQPLAKLKAFTENNSDKILFCVESAGRREALLELLASIHIQPEVFNNWHEFNQSQTKLGICIAPLEASLCIPEQLNLITENQLFGRQVFQRRRRTQHKNQAEQSIKHLQELKIDAPVVHIEHGVGRYLGLETISFDDQSNEFLCLEYFNQAKLYVPVTSLDLISRYTGTSDELAPLHKLGTEQWSKSKRKAAEKAKDSAAELLDIYARRALRKGFSFKKPEQDYQQFTAEFPFEESPDQATAINAVIADMTSTQPMDRLVCGDVGFGKTEVAMRATFIACQNSKQVVILVPTTLLAQQHFQNFSDRFADWPVKVELLSRFRNNKQQQKVIQQLEQGQVDIVIGTHKLLQNSIKFKDLGLMIIDEEHRFGVQQKERLKSLRSEVDILTLTATPIPRTLNMAMTGMRDLSIIATAPAARLSVKTFIQTNQPSIIKEAILRELLRGGQVYYLHNEIKSIERKSEEIAALIPEARVAMGHGQMPERQLEQVMSDFYHKRHNVLVCTTIIETGIDIPNANTMIIERSDKFGLAQLHQLRGRVGRSQHQAYAYLLTPEHGSISKDAEKRLEAISQSTELGAGFSLATQDLEIRGAGELLGEEQSGQMQAVGFTMFMEMLKQATKALKSGKNPSLTDPLQPSVEIKLQLPCIIPEDYLPDVHNRLIMYKRIAGAEDAQELKELQIEMIDRFGLLPEPTKHLLRQTELKLIAEPLGIKKIEAGAESGSLEFAPDTQVDPLTLVNLIQTQAHTYKLVGTDKLRFSISMSKVEQRFEVIEQLLQTLGAKNQ